MTERITVLLGDPSLPNPTRPERRFTPEDLDAVERLKTALAELDGYAFRYLDDHDTLLDEIAARPGFVLNFADTGYRNDASRELHIPALLELLGVPHSGAGPACLGLCSDKAAVRAIAATHGLPVPNEVFIRHDEEDLPEVVPKPALIKPARGDGSVGITEESVVRDRDAIERRVAALRSTLPGHDLLLQELLTGPEYAVGLIGNPRHGFTVLPILGVDYSGLPEGLPAILSYASRTDPASPYWTAIRYGPAELDDGLRLRLIERATLLFERLGCRDYARFDFRADDAGRVKLLEVNPNPAWCWDGTMNLMAGFRGWTYPELLAAILEAGLRREGLSPPGAGTPPGPRPAPAPGRPR